MSAANLLPPAYLLPGWSHGQIVLFSSRISQQWHRKRFSTYRHLAQAEPSDEIPNKIFGVVDGPEGQQIIQSYAYRREHRSEGSKEEIRKRLLGEKTGLIRRVSRHPHSTGKVHEADMIADYVKKQKLKSQRALFQNASLTRGTPFGSTLSQTQLDFTDEAAVTSGSTFKEKSPAPVGSDAFETLDSRLYPPLKRSSAPAQTAGNGAAKKIGGGVGAQASPMKSLLEELFPEEVAKEKGVTKANKESSPHQEPRELALPAVDDLQDDSVLKRPRTLARNVKTVSRHPLKPVPVLLVLENALPNLVAADFKRVSPKGKHIEEWNAMFNPSAIIPGRSDRTGECNGKYYLVFDTIGQAKAWRNRVELLHKITKLHAANSIVAPLIPRKGFSAEGEDIGETLREYSIFPSGVMPIIRLYSDPQADPTITDELNMITTRMATSDGLFQPGRSVLLWIDGWSTGTDLVIKKMLSLDGRARNMLWGDLGHNTILEDYHKQIPMVKEKDQDPTSTLRKAPKKWLITLQDEAEARRFVRAWHLRPFPAWLKYKKDHHDEPWPLVRVELIW